MYQVKINLQNLFYRLKLQDKNKQHKNDMNYYLKIYRHKQFQSKLWLNNKKIQLLSQSIPMDSQLISSISQLIEKQSLHNQDTFQDNQLLYLNEQQLKNIKIKYRFFILRQTKNSKNNLNQKKVKYLGQVLVQLQDNEFQEILRKLKDQKQKNKTQRACNISKKQMIKNSKDKESSVTLSIKIQEIPQFKLATIKNKLILTSLPKHPQQQLSQKQIQKQYQHQLLTQTLKSLQSLKRRKLEYQQQIFHLQQENHQLQEIIQQKQELHETHSNLRDDHRKIMEKKTNNIKQQYKKVKENLGQIINIVNEYGQMNVVDKVTEVMVGEV